MSPPLIVLIKSKDHMPWIGVDFDGTLIEHPKADFKKKDLTPVPRMVSRVKGWLKEGKDVRILTARVSPESFGKKKIKKQKHIIQGWCKKHLGKKLPVTCEKDHKLVAFYDDRAFRVQHDTGKIIR